MNWHLIPVRRYGNIVWHLTLGPEEPAACGRRLEHPAYPPTTDANRVTCASCRRTSAYQRYRAAWLQLFWTGVVQ